MVDAGLAVRWKEDLCLVFPVTSITGLGFFINHRSDLGLIRRDSDFTLFIENSNLDDALSLGHIVNDSLIFVSSVLDHGIANAQTNGLAEVKSLLFRFVENLCRERPDIEIEEKSFDHQNDNNDAEKDLCF